MRKRAMESLGESLGNKGDDEENFKKEKEEKEIEWQLHSCVLKEKSEMMQEMKNQEMELKKKEIELQDKQHDDFLRVMLAQQQQQQQQDFQTMMLAMMNRLTHKSKQLPWQHSMNIHEAFICKDDFKVCF